MKPTSTLLALAGSLALVALQTESASAQSSGGEWRFPSRPAGRTAAQPFKPKTPPVPPGQVSHLNPLTHRVPVAIVPAVLMSDGSIFANFGFGFEPVVRVCPGARLGPVIASNGVVLQAAPSTTHGPASTARMTVSQLARSGVPVHHAAVSDMARLACYASGGAPLAYVYR